jgi:glucokinase
MKVLAGDVGGTHCRLALCEVTGGKVRRDVEDVQRSGEHDALATIVRAFLAKHPSDVRAACFGLPGPIRGRRAQLTNLPWVVDADLLARDLALPSVSLLNDLQANAYGLATLEPEDLCILREGVSDPAGNAGLISPGTGLGEAGLHRVGRALVPLATEAGHTDFAPTTDLEIDLLRSLQAKLGPHVSWERVLSGPGLANLYGFFRERDPGAEPAWLAEELAVHDPGTVITRRALEGTSDLCRQALDLFMALLGAKAGNLALSVLATDGVYLGGGIAPRIAAELPQSGLLERFDGKGRMRPLLERMTIRVVLDDKAALQGAAIYAAQTVEP